MALVVAALVRRARLGVHETVMAPDADDPIAAQYRQWIYPQPVRDLAEHAGRQAADPALAHRLYWPDRDYRPGLDILVAGRGANQAAEIASHNRSARVLGIDVSETSLAHERYLKQRHGLDNLESMCVPIEAVESLGREFDLMISTGVLHHLADPIAGLRALGRCLKRDGVAVVMLYARYGRSGIDLLRSLFARLRLRQDAAGLAIVIRRQLASATLDVNQVALLQQVDGVRSVRGIVDRVTPPELRSRIDEVEQLARDFFQRLWALDIVDVRLPSVGA